MFSFLGEEGQSLITIFLLLIPAALYIMGLMEGRKGHYFFLSGIIFHLLSILQRALTLGGVPLTEKHDTISFMALATALTYWRIRRKKVVSNLAITVLPLISLLILASFLHAPVNTVSPFLRTPWFYLHIFTFFTSYSFFGIAACIGLSHLIHGSGEYEVLQYKGIISGWILFSVSLVVGSVWFYIAYGTYWLWTSRELWTTLTWSYYGLYLHARYIKGLSGKPSALIGCLGFLVALFAYFGVGTVIPAPPTQF